MGMALDGLNGQHLADDTGGSYDHVFRRNRSSFAMMSHIIWAFSSPSALQVLALPLLQMTAWASRRQYSFGSPESALLDLILGVDRGDRA